MSTDGDGYLYEDQEPVQAWPEPAEILTNHEFRFGVDTNCSCGAPGIFYWEDWVQHVASLLRRGSPR